MATSGKTVDITVRYKADTTALNNSLKNLQGLNFNIGGNNLKKELVSPISAAMRDINKAMASGADNQTLLKMFEDVNKVILDTKQQVSGFLSAINAGYNSAGNQQLLKDLKAYEAELKKAEKASADWTSKYGNAAISKAKQNANVESAAQARNLINKLEEQLRTEKGITEEENTQLANLKEYIQLLDERKKLKDSGITKETLEQDINIKKNKVDETKALVQTAPVNIESNKQYVAIIEELGRAAGLTAPQINNLKVAIENETKAAEEAEKQGKETLTKFGDVLTGTFLGTSISSLMNTGLRRGVDFFKEYDATLTRTMMVTGMTRDEVNELTSSYSRLANQLSSTTKDVAAAQLVFYQQGLSTNEAAAMTEASIAISKTGGIEAGEAANRLTAAVRGYKLAATEAMSIADKMSALDASAASSVDELTIAMQKSASQARMAGLDLDYYMAYLSTMQEVTREAPENIGTAMKSITSRLQEITDLGKVEEDGTTFSNVAKALNSVGIAAVDSSGQLRQLQDIMNELGPIWKDLDKNHRAYLATTLAGNRQQSRFIALMDNYDRAMELVSVSQNSAGNTAKQLRAYNQGLEASFTKLSDAWQQFANKIADTGTVKAVVDAITKLLNTINSLPTGLVKAAAGFVVFTKGLKVIEGFKTVFSGLKNAGLSGIFGNIGDITKHTKQIENIGKTTETAQKGYKGLINRTKEYFNTLLGGQSTVTQNIGSQEAMAASIETTNAARTSEIAIKKSDDGIDVEEVQENNNIRESQETLQYAIESTTEALKKQNDVYNQNGSAKLTQMQSDQRKAKNELYDLQHQRNEYQKQNKEAAKELKAQRATARAGYEEAIKPENLRREAEDLLIEEGLLDAVQTSLFPEAFSNTKVDKMIQARMQELKKQYGYWYHDVLETIENTAHMTFDPNNEYIADLDEKIKIAKDKVKKGAEDITKYEQEIAAKIQKNKLSQGNNQNISQNNQNNNTINNNNNRESLFSLNDIIQPFVVKTITETAASMLGLSTATGKVIAGFTSMGSVGIKVAKQIRTNMIKAGKDIGTVKTAAIAAGFALAGMALSWIASQNDLDAINEKLDKTLSERDSVSEKTKSLTDNLKTYEEISRKVIKTEEEQNQLNVAANNLASTLPNIVQGYDAMGNALVDVVRAQQELNELTKQEDKLNNEAITLYNKKTKASGQANPAAWAAGTAAVVAGPAMKIGAVLAPETAGLSLAIAAGVDAAAAGLAAGGAAIYNWVTGAKRLKEALVEDRNEIIALLQATTQVPEGMDGLKNTIIASVYSQGVEEEFGVDEMQSKIQEITRLMNNDVFELMINKFKFIVDDPHLDTTQMRERIIDELKNMGFSDSQIDLVYDGVVSVIWGGEINVSAIDKELKEYINGDYSKNIQNAAKEIYRVEARVKKDLYKSGFLTTDMLEHVFSDMKGEDIVDAFYKTGVYNELEGVSTILNETYVDISDKYIQMKKLKSENAMLDANTDYAEEQLKAAEERWKALGDDIKGFENIKDVKEHDFKDAPEYIKATYNDWKYWNDYINENNSEQEKNQKEIDSTNKELKNLEATLDKILDKYMEMTEMPTFEEMRTSINQAISPLKSLNSTLKEIYELDGRVTFDSLDSLLSSLQEIQNMTEKVGLSTEYWNQACGALADGLTIENGMIHLNIDSAEMMQKVAVAGYQAQIESMKKQVEARIAQAETERDILDKEIQFFEDKVLSAKDGAEAESIIENQLYGYLNDLHVKEVENTNKQFATQLRSASIYVNKMAAIMQKMYNGETVGESDYADAFVGLTEGLKKEIKEGVGTLTDNPEWKNSVNNYLDRLKAQRNSLNDQIEGEYKLKEKLTALLSSSDLDLGKMLGNGVEKASDALDDYIGKLERTFNLIQKIDRLAHQISDNANLKDLYKNYDGQKYADALLTELGLMKEQYEYRKQLFKMQQEEVGRQRGKIEDSPYASLFTFDANDLIQIDWDRYHNLSSRDQEEIDILVDKYEELQKAVESTEIEMAEFAKATQEAWLEIESTIIDAENAIVNALKNREKILHNVRQKALDDEIKMIEKAVEARQKANDSRKDNKELYEAQEALRRATLDSSGKNNASLLQLQKDLEEKQLEISEKRFEDDMDDRKQWLQDTKDAETETYEYRLETMTWYWEQAQEIMMSGTENIMNFLMQWDESYRVSSETQQNQILRGWSVMYEEIQRLYDNGFDLNTFHIQMASIVDDLAAQRINIESIETAWSAATRAANTYKASIGNIKDVAVSGGGTTAENGGKESGKVAKEPEPKAVSYFGVGDTVSTKDKGLNPVTYYDANGNKAGYKAGYTLQKRKVTNIVYIGEQFYYEIDSSGFYIKGLQLEGTRNGEKKKIYKKGGMVDYTGPAWVDGNKTHPEAFLSAYQTEQIGALAESLGRNGSTINNALGDSNITFGSINFNVASMSSAADGQKALDVFVKGANDLMAKKGIGTKLNLNIK